MTNTPRSRTPLVKWVGGKTQILHEIESRIPGKFNRYFEPFLGGGAVFFKLEPLNAVISDVNARLINFYQQVALNPMGLMDEVDLIAKNYLENRLEGALGTKVLHSNLRTEFNSESTDPLRSAALFLALNKTSFNGLYRENRSGAFNVPFNNFKTVPKFFTKERVLEASSLLRKVDIRCASFQQVLGEANDGDFVYLDPPYVPLNSTSDFTSYSASGFDIELQTKLLEEACSLRERGVQVMLSNSSAPWVFDSYLAKGFDVEVIAVKRGISARASARGEVKEVLILGY